MTAKNENLLLSLGANIAVPTLLLTKGAKWLPWLSPACLLIVALAFPCAYFVYDYVRRREVNFISILGFIGTLLTGGIGLFQLSPMWVAIKEAVIPALLACTMLVSRKAVNKFLYNERVFDVVAIDAALNARGSRLEFERTLRTAARLLFVSFVLSACLNFGLARWIVVTDPAVNAEAFNSELGKMMALSWPVIVAPCIIFIAAALWVLLRGMMRTTALPLEKLMRSETQK